MTGLLTMLSNKSKTALAVFVKTPELSDVKTRLGEGIGRGLAKSFYELSIDKIRYELSQLKQSKYGANVDIYWSLAEPFTPLHAIKWSDFKRIHQVGSGLGQRMHSVHCQLLKKGYSKVALIGGDSPQFTALDYQSWITKPLASKEVLLGPADDGGFYSLLSGDKISEQLWSSVQYSKESTAHDLAQSLITEGYKVSYLSQSYDIDFVSDLSKLQLGVKQQGSAASQKLLRFIEGLQI